MRARPWRPRLRAPAWLNRLDSRCLLPLTGLELHPKQQKQIKPEPSYETPIPRSCVQGASSQCGLLQFRDYAHQTAEPSEHVQSMSYGQYIEERVADVGGETESLSFQLHPGESLTGDKQQAQEECDVQPLRWGYLISVLTFQATHERRDAAARQLKSDTAGND